MRKTLLAVLSLALVAACVSRPVPTIVPTERPDFAVVAAGDSTLVLRNLSAEPVFYVVLEQEFSTRARWARCADPAECPRIEAKGDVRLPYAQITGFQPGARAAVIYWYKLLPGGRPGEVNTLSVPL